MKKIFPLLLLLLLGFAVYWFVFERANSTFNSKDTAFSIANTAEIDQIIITDREKRKVVLDRFEETDTWTIDKRYIIREDAMGILMTTLEKMRVNYPVPNSARKNVERMLTEKPKTVELFSNGKELKTIIMSGTTNDRMGTYMRLQGSEEAYVVHIPGFSGFLNTRFFTDINEWRTRQIFNYEPNEIQKITVDYPRNPQWDFELAIQPDGKPEIKPGAAITQAETPLPEDKQLNPLLAVEYLKSFQNVYMEAYDNYFSKKDSVLSELPVCKMKVLDKAGKTTEIVIYPLFQNERSKMKVDPMGKTLAYDRDRYFALVNDGKDFIIIQDFIFGELFKTYWDFFQFKGPSPKKPASSKYYRFG